MIPHSLWSKKDSLLLLPPQLISSWTMLLDKYQLREKAMTSAPEGFEGGMSKEDTDNHLAWRFTGSSARVMLTMLDPLQDLPKIPDVFARVFSGNKVFLADLPCGSGAASMGILSVFCELRKQKRIPRMPLHVVIVGGEISQYARAYAGEALESLRTELEAQAITVEFEILEWDVCDRFSTTSLIKQLTIKSQKCSAKLLVLANFSGFLEREKKWKEASKQFDELFRYSLDDNSIAIWIEPRENNVIQGGGFFSRLVNWFNQKFSKFLGKKVDSQHNSYLTSYVKVSHPLTEGEFRVNLAVIRFDLPRRS
ncbi:MAG: hypothetical protein J7647_30575 [Cyanobacteria bacterium SBLK]|nr:hypothetical protein [Cyanobacteria bacterium SBLK]